MLIDTHCHLSYSDYESLDAVIKNMDGLMIASGCDDKTNNEVIDIVNKYDNVYGTLGIHPENLNDITLESFKNIIDNLNNPKIVGIGEIGLDYHYTKDNVEYQKEVFKKQLDIAKKYNMPVVIHSRDAIKDTYDILKEYNIKGSIHCFSSSLDMAKKFIKLGYKIGIGGVLTFKNSEKLKDIVRNISLNDILIETDSPYLAPEPLRGQRNNPSNVYLVAKKISELKNIDIDIVIKQTFENACELFDLKL